MAPVSAEDHLGLQFSSNRVNELTTAHYARRGLNVVGYASTNHPAGEPVELAALHVGEAYQGQGVGHKLLDHVIQHHDGQSISLHPEPFGNKAMDADHLRSFYSSHGFRQLKRPLRNGDDMIRRPKR